ncbi:MAG: hypothetical protein AAB706_01140 [Patescibacteria group bacterium]
MNGEIKNVMPEEAKREKLSLRQKIILAIVAFPLLFVFYVSLDANKYKAYVRVVPGEGIVGVNPTDKALDFGDLSRGGRAVRKVAIQNGTFIPVQIVVLKWGSIADLMDVNKDNFKLSAGENAEIEFTTYVPASAEIDKIYNGRVYLFKIPRF